MAAGAEIEVKFLFAERDLAKINALISAVPAARPPLHQRLRAIYFDTPNRDLWKHGFILRIRASGKSYIQTVKRESVVRHRSQRMGSRNRRVRPRFRPDQKNASRQPRRQTFHPRRAAARLRSEGRAHLPLARERRRSHRSLHRSRRDPSEWRQAWRARARTRIEKRRPPSPLRPCPRLRGAGAALSKPHEQSRTRPSSCRGRLRPGGERFEAASHRGYDMRANLSENLPDLPARFRFESGRLGEAPQCRGGASGARRNPASSCRHGAV